MTPSPASPIIDDGAAPVYDLSLTDLVDPLVAEDRWVLARRLVTARTGIRIDEGGVAVRRLLRPRRLAWSELSRVELDSRLDRAVALTVELLPIARVPVVGDLAVRAVGTVATAATRRVVPGARDRVGWAVARFVHRDDDAVEVTGAVGVVALVHPRLLRVVEHHAERHDVPIVRRDA